MARNTEALALYNRLTPDEIVARCQAAAAQNDATAYRRYLNPKGGTAHVVQKGSKRTSWLETPSRNLKSGRLLAERIILERGGKLTPLPSYDDYFAEYEAAKQDVEATA